VNTKQHFNLYEDIKNGLMNDLRQKGEERFVEKGGR
jgi:hypothetical protein